MQILSPMFDGVNLPVFYLVSMSRSAENNQLVQLFVAIVTGLFGGRLFDRNIDDFC